MPGAQLSDTVVAWVSVTIGVPGAPGGTASDDCGGRIATPWVATLLMFMNSPPSRRPDALASIAQMPKKLSIGGRNEFSRAPVVASATSRRTVWSPIAPSWNPK